jgi:hypothetical protein
VNGTNASTVGTRKVAPAALYLTNFTFTANTTLGSNLLTNVSSVNDLAVGASLAGAGIPGGTTLVPYAQAGASGANNGNPIRNDRNTLQMSAAATATAAAVVITVTGVLTANLQRPTIGTSN